MNCFRCNKEGATSYKYKVGSRIETVFLCESCSNALFEADGRRSAPSIGADSAGKAGSLFGVERRCPSCGTKLSAIRKTGYIGCAGCFTYFKSELLPLIDAYQDNVIYSPKKKRREMSVILLENEYYRLSAKENMSLPERNAVSARLKEIERELNSLGVSADD